MLEYYLPKSSVSIELTILSGGTTVTGRTPTVLIRKRDINQYFDFSTRKFSSTPVSATAVLTSAIDGLYTYSWDTSNLFQNDTYLTFEYHDSTAFATDDVLFSTKPSGGGVGGSTIVKGVWTAKQKEKLFKDIKTIDKKVEGFREKSIELLRRILGKETLTKENLKEISHIKARDLKMYQELLKILDLKSDTNEGEVFSKLQQYIEKEELAKSDIIEKLNKMLGSKKEPPKNNNEEDRIFSE